MSVRGQLLEVSSLLLPLRSLALNSGHQTWQQTLPAEPSLGVQYWQAADSYFVIYCHPRYSLNYLFPLLLSLYRRNFQSFTIHPFSNVPFCRLNAVQAMSPPSAPGTQFVTWVTVCILHSRARGQDASRYWQVPGTLKCLLMVWTMGSEVRIPEFKSLLAVLQARRPYTMYLCLDVQWEEPKLSSVTNRFNNWQIYIGMVFGIVPDT